MCENNHGGETNGALAQALEWQQPDVAGLAPEGISRRTLLRFMGVSAVAVGANLSGLLPGNMRLTGASAATGAVAPGFDGDLPMRVAEHIHTSHSEGVGSMSAQAAEAASHVDAVFFSDHDWREAGVGAPSVVHFNSLNAENLGPNPPWTWNPSRSGSLDTAASTGGIDSKDVSPNDPDQTGALYARAVSTGADRASNAWFADDSKLRNSMRTPASGQNWQVDVKLREAGPDAWGFMRVALSYHPASGGRPPAYYFIEYRFGPFPQKSYSVEQLDVSSQSIDAGGDGGGTIKLRGDEQALLGVVWVPQKPGAYNTQSLTFTDDIAQIFPDMPAEDNSIRNVWFGATSRGGAPANAAFDYLRMSRVRGQQQFDNRANIAKQIAAQYPNLSIYDALELSYGGGHRHWLGGNIHMPDYGTDKAKGAAGLPNSTLVRMVLDGGGMPILNHPFGTNGPKMTDAQAHAEAQDIVNTLLANGAEGGLQGLETFYRSRAGASLEQHLYLARLAMRNGLVLALSGVSDNHWGRVGGWAEETNHFVTGIYAPTLSETDLVEAQRRGRAYAAEIGSFEGQIDLSFRLGGVVMGQYDVRPGVVSRTLDVRATALPKNGVVELWQVPIDGRMDGDPGAVIQTLPASAFANSAGTASVVVDTNADSAFMVTVGSQSKTGAIRRTGGSNPIAHLKAEPTTWKIPDYRRVN